jgi:hypothetical protein
MSARELMTYASRYGGAPSFSFMNLFNLFSTPKENKKIKENKTRNKKIKKIKTRRK